MVDIKYTFVVSPLDTLYMIVMKSYEGDVCTRNEMLQGLTIEECIAAQQQFITPNN